VEQVYKLAQKGFIDRELADFFKVKESTITRWKDKYPDFCTSLKRGKDEFDTGKVENTLLRRALGYQYTEKTQTLSKPDPETGETKLITVKQVTKEVVPDTTAIIFWLKNRQPDRWRDKQILVHGVSLNDVLSVLPKDFADGVRKELRVMIERRNKNNG
jgi:hypothetical protein